MKTQKTKTAGKTAKKHMYFVDLNIVANSKEEVIKIIGKKAYKLACEIRDQGETEQEVN
jgi:hypothetical protein